VREYVPGDPLNRIHWLSTARRNELIVKEFELDPMADVWIFLDAERRVQAEQSYSLPSQTVEALWAPWKEVNLPPSTEEYAVSIAASLARHFLRRDRAVGLVSQHQTSQRTPSVLPPDRGGRQLGKILEALAPLHADGDMPISALVTAHVRHMPRGSTVVIVTPSVEQDVALAADLSLQRGLRPVVVLLDAGTFGGRPGTTSLSNAVTALSVPICRVKNGDRLATALSAGLDSLSRTRPVLGRMHMADRVVRS
jgi:uncharacterized protein (DUF58 family)